MISKPRYLMAYKSPVIYIIWRHIRNFIFTFLPGMNDIRLFGLFVIYRTLDIDRI